MESSSSASVTPPSTLSPPNRTLPTPPSDTDTLGDHLRKWCKSVLGRLFYWSGLYRLFLRDRAVVVLFHRIHDAHRDGITCTSSQFARFCDFFRRFFIVVPLSELLDRLDRGQSISRHLVITFDDGYLCNYRSAFEELVKRDLPACFFVATEFIGSKSIAWWDDRNGIPSEWMTWEHVRTMRAHGFELAPHTMTHADLGAISPSTARDEILRSQRRLAEELGETSSLFAFPYGQAENITEANREVIRELGMRCCLAAAGGAVAPDSNPMRLNRTAINSWFTSTYQFGFELLYSSTEPRPPAPVPLGAGVRVPSASARLPAALQEAQCRTGATD